MSGPDLSMQVDIVDLHNRPIGHSTRRDLLPKKLNFRTVHDLISVDGRLILQKLPLTHPRSPGRLGSSAAGYLMAGESYQDAAHRKLYEELRLVAPLQDLGEVRMIDSGSYKFVGVFAGKTDRKPRFDPAEVAELVYIEPDRLANMVSVTPYHFTRTFLHVFPRYRAAVGGGP